MASTVRVSMIATVFCFFESAVFLMSFQKMESEIYLNFCAFLMWNMQTEWLAFSRMFRFNGGVPSVDCAPCLCALSRRLRSKGGQRERLENLPPAVTSRMFWLNGGAPSVACAPCECALSRRLRSKGGQRERLENLQRRAVQRRCEVEARRCPSGEAGRCVLSCVHHRGG